MNSLKSNPMQGVWGGGSFSRKSKFLKTVWISPLKKSKLVLQIWIYPMEKSVFGWLLGFIQWGNPNWFQKYRFLHRRNPYMHAYMHIFGLWTKYAHVCKQIWIYPLGESKFLTPVWIFPLEKSKLVLENWIYAMGKSIYACIYAHIWVTQICAYLHT